MNHPLRQLFKARMCWGQSWTPIHSHHGIADRLGDGAMVPNCDVKETLEVPLHTIAS
jgi:hypothetical protein